MSKYAGTKTEKNLMDAFAGESQARNKYTYYASVAKKAGYEQMAALYLETGDTRQPRHADEARSQLALQRPQCGREPCRCSGRRELRVD